MQTNYQFTHDQIRTKLANWTLQSLTGAEINYLDKYLSTHADPITFGENDIESLILEIISEI